MLDEAFGILQDAKSQGILLGTISYSSLMGACCNVCAFYSYIKSFVDVFYITSFCAVVFHYLRNLLGLIYLRFSFVDRIDFLRFNFYGETTDTIFLLI